MPIVWPLGLYSAKLPRKAPVTQKGRLGRRSREWLGKE
jgi:hypothetical protein